MKIVIAPDSFKGSLSAEAFCNVVGREAAKIFESAEIIKLPVSDGGEGMVDSLLAVTENYRKGKRPFIRGNRSRVWHIRRRHRSD